MLRKDVIDEINHLHADKEKKSYWGEKKKKASAAGFELLSYHSQVEYPNHYTTATRLMSRDTETRLWIETQV